MKSLQRIPSPSCGCALRYAASVLALALFPMEFGNAAEATLLMLKPPVALVGGLAGGPTITSLTRTGDLVQLEWFGIRGPYQLLHGSSPESTRWLKVGAPTTDTQMTLNWTGDLGAFRVSTAGNSNPGLIGAESCWLCHVEAPEDWHQTPHGQAFDALKNVGQANNRACLPCHTTGFGQGGFQSEATTPHFAGVQCESCHGPAAAHLAHIRDLSVRPAVTVAAEVCGGCHNFHHPTFDEWKQSLHGQANPDVAGAIRQQGEPRIESCGPCHSGASRLALLKRMDDPLAPLPATEDAAFFPITCAVCHDPHATAGQTGNPGSLRNPLFSLTPFSLDPNRPFPAQYNPAIQLCGQCHNSRGAQWEDTSRAPHPSPQYNVLIGQGAYDLGLNFLSGHSDIENQCVFCHSGTAPASAPGQSQGYVGHTFQVNSNNCAVCHITSRAAERAKNLTQQQIKSQIQEIKGLLDRWATGKAPAELQTKYGALAWEYSIPGPLSSTGPDAKGPATDEQGRIPDRIKQARFNLYLVLQDGSFGVHNGTYARHLLSVARDSVNAEL